MDLEKPGLEDANPFFFELQDLNSNILQLENHQKLIFLNQP